MTFQEDAYDFKLKTCQFLMLWPKAFIVSHSYVSIKIRMCTAIPLDDDCTE